MNITSYKNILNYFAITFIAFLSAGCDDIEDTAEIVNAPYVLSLGITSSGTTNYYVVATDDLMNGNINAVGKGIEQNGYRDYEQGGNTIFSVGGLGVNFVTGVTRSEDGYLQERGDFIFNSKLSAFNQVDDKTMLAMEIPDKAADGNKISFYIVDINSVSITKTITQPIAPIAELEWPSI